MQQDNELFGWMESVGSSSDLDTDQAFSTLQFIAINPITPQPVLALLAAQGSIKLLECVAGNPSCSQGLLAQLARHEALEVRVAVCDNPNIDKQIIDCLLQDESVDVRYALAENHHLPTYALEQLSEDDNAYVAFRARQTMQRLEGNAGLATKVVQWFSRGRSSVEGGTGKRGRRLG